MEQPEPYTISGIVYLPDTVADTSVLVEKDVNGYFLTSTISTMKMYEFIYQTNVPFFEVWCVPPSSMVGGGPSGASYTLSGWQSAQPTQRDGSTPASALMLHYFDESGGALDLASGVFTVPVSGNYRHSMTLQVKNFTSSQGSSGVFVQVNGVRTVGDYYLNAGDNAFAEYHHFHTELWHNAGDRVAFVTITNGGDGTAGTYARWVVVRASAMLPANAH
jgi:hypothetical protein